MDNLPQPNRLMPVLVVLLIVASFLIGSLYSKVNLLEKGVGTGVAANNGQVAGAGDQPLAEPTPQPVDIEVAGLQMLGNKNAKVAIVEYTDYQCPFCQRLVQDTFPQIKKEYIDTGKVKYYVKDYPLTQIHPQAQKSAEAASCATDQNKFWEYHDKLFANQQALTDTDLKKYAVDLGLNAGTFNTCLDTGKYTEKVKKDTEEGTTFGVRGTPASFVGVVDGDTVKQAMQVSGAVPFETFKVTIEQALSQ